MNFQRNEHDPRTSTFSSILYDSQQTLRSLQTYCYKNTDQLITKCPTIMCFRALTEWSISYIQFECRLHEVI